MKLVFILYGIKFPVDIAVFRMFEKTLKHVNLPPIVELDLATFYHVL